MFALLSLSKAFIGSTKPPHQSPEGDSFPRGGSLTSFLIPCVS
ncbi:MAG: hypothetical protein ACI4RP_01550 [Acutalibacteraceae bacterium]